MWCLQIPVGLLTDAASTEKSGRYDQQTQRRFLVCCLFKLSHAYRLRGQVLSSPPQSEQQESRVALGPCGYIHAARLITSRVHESPKLNHRSRVHLHNGCHQHCMCRSRPDGLAYAAGTKRSAAGICFHVQLQCQLTDPAGGGILELY